jgi:thiaminase (transcriptional activator TenA)
MTIPAGPSERMFALGRAGLDAQLAHPTVRGIAAGTLDEAVFRRWLVQDWLFLHDYVRVFALAAARAPDADSLGRLVDLAHATFHDELALHRSYAQEFGLTDADLARARKSPSCAAYTDFLLRTAATGDFADVLAALLPCMWGYSELGRTLAAAGMPAEPRYRRWVETYADPGFAELAAWCARLLDRAAEGLPAWRLEQLERCFGDSMDHELAFWDA